MFMKRQIGRKKASLGNTATRQFLLNDMYKIKKRINDIGLIAVFFICLLALVGCSGMQNSTETKLFYSITTNNLEGVLEVINGKETIDYENLPYTATTDFKEDDSRALAIAIDLQNAEIVEALLKTENVKVEPEYLQTAISNYPLEIVEVLFKETGAEKLQNNEIMEFYASFVYPYLEKKEERARILLENGCSINQDVIEASLDNEWRYWYTRELVAFADKKGISYNLPIGIAEAVKGDNAGLQKLIEEEKIQDRDNVLLLASATCNVETLTQMDQNGYNFFITDAYGLTPLHIASLCNDKDAVEFLLDKGLNIEEITEKHYSPITYAAIGAKKDNIALLLSKGASFQRGEEYQYQDDFAPAWTWGAACRNGKGDSIQTLLQMDYELSTYDQFVIYAYSNDEIFQEALKIGLPFDVMWEGESPLEYTCEEHTMILLKKGAKDCALNFKQAVEYRNHEMLEILLKDKSNDKKILSDTLRMAIEYGDLKSINLILDTGLDINGYINEDGTSKTPLHLAASCPSLNVVEFLLKQGADTEIKDSDGLLPIDYAKEYGYTDTVELLMKW